NLTAAAMTILLLLGLFIPFFIFGLTLTENITAGLKWIEAQKGNNIVPSPPEWVGRIPLIGENIKGRWAEMSENAGPVLRRLTPWFQQASLWMLKHSLDFAAGVFNFGISLLIAFFLYRDGEGLIANLQQASQKITGDSSQRLMEIIKNTIHSVIYGTIGTALAQAIAAGIGFAIAGVPSPVLLAMITFILGFIPYAPPIVWIIASLWLLTEQHPGWAIFMFVYGIFCISGIDNIVRPFLISRKSKLSFIVTLLGVLGGLAVFGFIGVFLGPILLAIGYTIAQEILNPKKA
ncbi:MAG: AI-2E family transporter, partial [Ignavibacteriae bacterium]